MATRKYADKTLAELQQLCHESKVDIHDQETGEPSSAGDLIDILENLDATCPAMTKTELLTVEFEAFCAAEGLAPMSADELLYELLPPGNGTEHQKAYLQLFIERWDEAQKQEDES